MNTAPLSGNRIFKNLRFRSKLLVLALVSVIASSYCTYVLTNVRTPVFLALGAVLMVIFLYIWRMFYVSMRAGIGQLHDDLRRFRSGDMQVHANINGTDELAELAQDLNKVVHSFSRVSAEIRSYAALVSQVGIQLNLQSKELSSRTEQQAASLEETSACLEEISSVVQLNADNANHANDAAKVIWEQATKGVDSMGQAVNSVAKIKAHSEQMQSIMEAIDRLSAQTTILALNASIEAARAGEQGRGFAVVAAEVRSLAQRSSESAHMVRKLMSESAEGVDQSLGLIRRTAELLHEMTQGIEKMSVNSQEISKSTTEQSTGINEVTIAVQQLDQITQKNAHMVDDAVQDAVKLSAHAENLMHVVSRFKLQQGTADEAIKLVEKAVQASKGVVSNDAFVAMITNPNNGFYDKDMYVFALDDDGHYLAFGGQPAKVGTRVQDIPGIAGQKLVDDIIDQANSRPGWVEYDINNPLTGKVQTKMSFVQKLNGLYVGCGVYKSLAH